MGFREETKDGKVKYFDERFDIIELDDVCLIDKSRHYGLAVREVKPALAAEYHLGGNGEGIQIYFSEFLGKDVEVPGDPLSWIPALWERLLQDNDIKSILDVGSGIGYSSKWFADRGLDVTAIEGLAYNVKNAVYPTKLHDLSRSSYKTDDMFDLVWCCEVAEHVSESAIDFFVDTITNCRILALTAAPPGDGGHHHVNCQPVEYWIEKIEKSGMKIEVDKTNHMRSVAKSFGPRSDSHFMRNGMIFYREI